MIRATKSFVLIGLLCLGVAVCAAQLASEPADPQKAATVDATAEQFIQELHSTLDIGALGQMFAPETAARYRDYPGDFLPFDSPRVSKALLKATDDATLHRKLVADWNLHYLLSVMLVSSPGKDRVKVLPPEFVKLAKKSKHCRSFIGDGGPVTLASDTEMTEYLAEAGQLVAILRQNIKPEMLNSSAYRAASDKARTQFGPPRQVIDALGYDKVYTVARESVMLVMAETGREMKLVWLAPLPF
ncbi:MAG: hypothetical protein ACE14L_08875 [Terriglobales bacterium]